MLLMCGLLLQRDFFVQTPMILLVMHSLVCGWSPAHIRGLKMREIVAQKYHDLRLPLEFSFGRRNVSRTKSLDSGRKNLVVTNILNESMTETVHRDCFGTKFWSKYLYQRDLDER